MFAENHKRSEGSLSHVLQSNHYDFKLSNLRERDNKLQLKGIKTEDEVDLSSRRTQTIFDLQENNE